MPEVHDCKFEKQLFDMGQNMASLLSAYKSQSQDIADIKSTQVSQLIDIADIKSTQKSQIKDMTRHIEQGDKWRIAVLGIALSLVLELCAFCYSYGTVNNRVKHLENETVTRNHVD